MKKNNYPVGILAAVLLLGSPHTMAGCLGMVLHAHRGSHDAPENSTLAVERAFEGNWDGAEIDIQQLRDQEWVLHHDALLGRTTTLKRYAAADVDSSVWKEVRLRNRNGTAGAEPAPFLVQVLKQVADNEEKVLNVEIKQFTRGCTAAHQAIKLLAEGRPNGRWFVTSLDRKQLQCVRQADPRGYVGQIVLDPKALAQRSPYRGIAGALAPKVIDRAWLARLREEVGLPLGVHVDAATLASSPDLLTHAHELGISVFTYSLRDDKSHARVLHSTAKRTGLLPSGAIIDGSAGQFCSLVGTP